MVPALVLLQTTHTCRMARQTSPLRTPPHPALDKLLELAPSVPAGRTETHQSRRARHCAAAYAEGYPRQWKGCRMWPGYADRSGGRHCLHPLYQNSWLHCYSPDRHLSVRARTPAGRTARRALSASRRRNTVRHEVVHDCDVWSTPARPLGSRRTRSLALVHRCASKRIPAHPKCARAHPAWLGAQRSCQEFLRQRE